MAKSGKIFSYIFIFLGAMFFLAAAAGRRVPEEMENLIAREIDIIVYVNESVSAEDINVFIEKFTEMHNIFIKDFKSSIQVLEELKKDSVIAAELESIDREFSPPHTFVLGVHRVDPFALADVFPVIRTTDNVEFLDAPIEEVSAASAFLDRLAFFSMILMFALCAAALLLIYFGALFYYYFFSEIIDAAADIGAPFIKIISSGLTRQFFTGILCAIASSVVFYSVYALSGAPVFSIQSVFISAVLTAALSVSVFALICIYTLKKH